MANKARGKTLAVIGGSSYTISLGMGALAEIEDAFGVESFEDALNFEGKVSARRLRKLLVAILTGNEIAITDEVKSAINKLDMDEFMAIITALMNIPGLVPAAAGEASGPLGGRSVGKRG